MFFCDKKTLLFAEEPPQSIRTNNPYVALRREEYFEFCFGVLKQLLDYGVRAQAPWHGTRMLLEVHWVG